MKNFINRLMNDLFFEKFLETKTLLSKYYRYNEKFTLLKYH